MKRFAPLLALAALAGLGSSPSVPGLYSPPTLKDGPINNPLPNDKEFTDSRGRKYVRDERGTVRRAE